MARTAQEISAIPDLPPPLPAVGARRRAGTHLAGPSQGVASPRETSTGGGFYPLSFTGAKKGASQSGPPSAAKERKSSLSPRFRQYSGREGRHSRQSHSVRLTLMVPAQHVAMVLIGQKEREDHSPSVDPALGRAGIKAISGEGPNFST